MNFTLLLTITACLGTHVGATLKSGCWWGNVVTNLGISEHNIAVVKTGNLEACKAECESRAQCKSVDFKLPTTECSLNDVNTNQVALSSWPDYVFTEIKCPGVLKPGCSWSNLISNLGISQHNIAVVTTGDLESCKAECLSRDGCKSVDFKLPTKQCSLNDVNTKQVSLSSWPNYVFTEIECPSGLKPGCSWGNVITNLGISQHNIAVITTGDLETCKEECAARDQCKSVDFKLPTGQCSLNDVNTDQVALSSWPNYVFVEFKCSIVM